MQLVGPIEDRQIHIFTHTPALHVGMVWEGGTELGVNHLSGDHELASQLSYLASWVVKGSPPSRLADSPTESSPPPPPILLPSLASSSSCFLATKEDKEGGVR